MYAVLTARSTLLQFAKYCKGGALAASL